MADLNSSLLVLLGAAVVLYAGVRLLWSAVPWAGLWRGAVLSLPVIALALYHAPLSPGTAVAMLVSAAVLALTLGLGVSTIDLPVAEAEGSPTLRAVLPLAATVCLAGFHGTQHWWHAAALAVVGGLTLWTADGERRTPRGTASPWLALPAAILLAGGLAGLTVALRMFTHASGSAVLTPVVVLLTVPAVLLAVLGLLTAEARQHLPETPHETAAGLAIACLGVGLPLVIGVGLATRTLAPHLGLSTTRPTEAVATQPVESAILATTQPAVLPPVVMPLTTWRIDSVLLVVVGVMLLPVGSGRFKVGRAEGAWLILLYLAYAAVATRAGATAG